MSEQTTERAQSPTAPELPELSPRAASRRAFLALLERDAWVTFKRDLAAFLAQSLMQPLFFLFIFGRVLPTIGQAGPSYGAQLLPGIIALTTFITALQNTSLPLVIEFSFTKEIEDRLLAPLSATLVGLEKVAFASIRAIIAALLIFPLAMIVLPAGVDWGAISVLPLAALLVAGAAAGAAVGLLLGTSVPANKINVVFAVVLTPLIFTGATFYPWQALGGLRWFQLLTLANPLTYVSEGMRGAMTGTPHLATGWVVLGLGVSIAVFVAAGLRGFLGRAVD
jgi:ABC-2 type transport system permease protein